MKTKLLLPTLALASSIFFNSCVVSKKADILKNISSTEQEKTENEKTAQMLDNMMKGKKIITLNLLEQWKYENPEIIDDLTLSKIITSYKEIENPVEYTVNIDWIEYEVSLVHDMNIDSGEMTNKVYITKKKDEHEIRKNCVMPEPATPISNKKWK